MDNTDILIYIVDDDPSVREALRMLLASANMEAKIFRQAEDFLKCKHREEGTCLITDLKMPGLSGIDLQRRLNANGSRIPVIFLTAFDTYENRQQAKEAGAVAYFRKPVDDQALLDTIRWALSNGSALKE